MPLPESKLSDEQKADVVNRYKLGETYAELAFDFRVSVTTIRKYVKKGGGERPRKQRVTSATSMVQFKKRAKSILWRQDKGKERPTYEKWMDTVADFEKGGMNAKQAIVQASKDFPCLNQLFREYDVGENDPHPDSHPTIQRYGQRAFMDEIRIEGKDQSHYLNFQWAIAAAGKFLNTGEQPGEAPNDAAFFLYRQARDDPKDFMGKFTQVDLRSSDDVEEQRLAKRSGKRSIEEINEMLQTLTEENNDETTR